MIGTLLLCATLVAVDDDTIKCNGMNMRDMGDGAPFADSYDAPAIWGRGCQAELDLCPEGKVPHDRAAGDARGAGDRLGGERQHARATPACGVVDGRTVGSVLIEEGLAATVYPPDYAAQ